METRKKYTNLSFNNATQNVYVQFFQSDTTKSLISALLKSPFRLKSVFLT